MEVQMRMKKRQMSDEMAKEILREGEYGVLSTICADNTPYSTPLNYVYYDNAIFFHCANEGHKLDNIRHNSSVCFSVVSQAEVVPEKFTTKFKSVIVTGFAQILDKSRNYVPLMALTKKYCNGFMDESEDVITRYTDKTTVVRIEIARIVGKINNV